MRHQAKRTTNKGKERPQRAVEILYSLVLPGMALVALAFAIGEIGLPLAAGSRLDGRLDGMVILAAVSASTLLGLRLLTRHSTAGRLQAAFPAPEPLKELLDSAGPMIMGVGLDGKFTYLNPAAERMLCYNAAELKHLQHAGEI